MPALFDDRFELVDVSEWPGRKTKKPKHLDKE